MKKTEQQQFIRIAALGYRAMGMYRVKVIFMKGGRPKNPTEDREEKAYWMSEETYRSIPLGVDATPEDYEEFGEIIESNNTDIYDIETN